MNAIHALEELVCGPVMDTAHLSPRTAHLIHMADKLGHVSLSFSAIARRLDMTNGRFVAFAPSLGIAVMRREGADKQQLVVILVFVHGPQQPAEALYRAIQTAVANAS